MMDFSTLKGLTIPEGKVKKITDSSGAVIWESGITFYVATSYQTFTINVPSGSTWDDAALIYNKSANSTNPFKIYVKDYTVYFEFYHSGARMATINGVLGMSVIKDKTTYTATSV